MLEPFAYLEALVELRRAWALIDPFAPEYEHRAHVVSASLSHLLPAIPRGRHAETIREIRFQQAWGGLDERSLLAGEGTGMLDFLLRSTRVEDPGGALPRAAAGEPFLFCAFHHGSHRILHVLLGAAGVKLAAGPDPARVDGAGGSLLAYADGNPAASGMRRRDGGAVPVRLLGHTLLARSGTASLAHAAGVPLVPVVCERTGWLERRTTFHPALCPGAEADREGFSRRATQEAYSRLEPALLRAPEQWEGWLYVHKYLDEEALAARVGGPRAPAATGGALVLDAERWVLLSMRGTPVLFDRATYRATPLSGAMGATVEAFRRPALAADARCDARQVRELVERGVLVASPPAG